MPRVGHLSKAKGSSLKSGPYLDQKQLQTLDGHPGVFVSTFLQYPFKLSDDRDSLVRLGLHKPEVTNDFPEHHFRDPVGVPCVCRQFIKHCHVPRKLRDLTPEDLEIGDGTLIIYRRIALQHETDFGDDHTPLLRKQFG